MFLFWGSRGQMVGHCNPQLAPFAIDRSAHHPIVTATRFYMDLSPSPVLERS